MSRRPRRRPKAVALALALAAASIAAGCSKIARFDDAVPANVTAAPLTVAPPDTRPGTASIDLPGRTLSTDGRDADCDHQNSNCSVMLAPGALPRQALQYRLAPGAVWHGSIERQQNCKDSSGIPHGEAVRASVTAEITAADAAGNLLMTATVTDVVVSVPDVDPAGVLEFPLGAKTNAVFSTQGLTVRPIKPPTYAAALITPLPPDDAGLGGRWESRTPGPGLTDVRQMELTANGSTGFSIEGITGDWLDAAKTKQRLTGTFSTQSTLDSVGPIHRTIVAAGGVGCFVGNPDGPVRYVVARDPAAT